MQHEIKDELKSPEIINININQKRSMSKSETQ